MIDYYLFSAAVILDAFRDHLVFHRPFDNGYWSLHTLDTLDAWHHSKLLFWLFIVLGFMYGQLIYSPIITILTYAIINVFLHEVMLHFVFRILYGYSFRRCIELYLNKWKNRVKALIEFLMEDD